MSSTTKLTWTAATRWCDNERTTLTTLADGRRVALWQRRYQTGSRGRRQTGTTCAAAVYPAGWVPGDDFTVVKNLGSTITQAKAKLLKELGVS